MRMFKHSLNPKVFKKTKILLTIYKQPKERWDVKEIRKFIEKERLSKNKNSSDDAVYYPDEGVGSKMLEINGKQSKKTSTIGQCKVLFKNEKKSEIKYKFRDKQYIKYNERNK